MIKLQSIRTSKLAKGMALVLVLEMTMQFVEPIAAFALTTGPSQPEMLSFEPVGTSEMVNAFSGDFTYNIPLLDVGGYPINMSYNSGITTDQEASWVGLGWNINPGAISRSMRGLPDDFDGDPVTKRFNMKPNRTYSAGASFGAEAFGFNNSNLSYGITMSYNNYTGVGYQQSLNMSFTADKGAKGELTGGLGVTSGADGLNLTPSVSFKDKIGKKESMDVKGMGRLSLSMNSRSGLRQLSLSTSVLESSTSDELSVAQRRASTTATNGGSSISFASTTYTPQVSMPMVNTSVAVSLKVGGTLFGIDGTFDVNGAYAEQKLDRKEESLAAYGYLNSQNGALNDFAMHDFNREKDGSFTENTPSLPMTNYTYDVYSVNGQGIGGMYRPYRSDMGHVYDAQNATTSFSGNLGVELGAGNLLHNGVDISVTDVNTVSGRWSVDNLAVGALRFKGKTDATISTSYQPLYEPFYFKEAGEKSVDSDPALYAGMGGDQPIRMRLYHQPSTMNVEAKSEFLYDNDQTNYPLPALNYRTARQRRNQVISTLSVGEARKYGLQKSFYSSSISSAAKDHHIGEISVLRSDGSRYIFGLPAYNNYQQEVSFNAQGRSVCNAKGIVTYQAGDNSVANALGIDNYFNETETPGYAHSFLLTAVVSPDYVDYDNIEGPSAGDLGSYTRFNYVKAASQFNWRAPINDQAYSANFSEGMKSDPTDDKGNYVFGQKEIWYVSSIETKSYVAVFSLSDREDGLGVQNKDGLVYQAPGYRLKKIDKIALYSKPDYAANPSTAKAIKTVHFTYDYSLCPGVPNKYNLGNGTGKLSLKKIHFTYSNSSKAKLSGYTFSYADLNHDGTQDVNYSYNPKANDRWGTYKPMPTSMANCTSTYNAGSELTPSEYPYSDQSRTLNGVGTNATKYAAAWALTDINLPSGGTISIDYEADDYAYVQDKKAAQMFQVTDFLVKTTGGQDPATVSSINTGINPRNLQAFPFNNANNSDEYYLYFKLQEGIPNTLNATLASDKIYKDYFSQKSKDIYFRFLTDITQSDDYEYVSGYFDLDYQNTSNAYSYGTGVVTTPALQSGGNYQYAWVRMKRVNIGDRVGSDNVNPLCKAAWQFGRLHLSRKVWNEPDPQGPGVDQVITAMTNSNFMLNLIDLFKGPNKAIRDKGFGREAMMNKSWIRLNNPNGLKYGGGSRVKKIAIKDRWKRMVNPPTVAQPNGDPSVNSLLPSGYDAEYGQEYSYTIPDPQDASRTISSGVAAYEPQQGSDENPFHEPVYFSEEKRLVPDDESYIEKPYGESFFPSPSVGYSRVTVKSLSNGASMGNGQVTKHNTGYTVQDFYTAYDFPTITRVGWMDVQHWRTNPILSLLRIDMKDYLTASQGFVVELNDMHGKPKTVTVYEQGKTTPLSQVRYFYKTNPNNGKQLDNTVLSIGKDGVVAEAICGMDYDFVADMRQQETAMVSGGVNMNVAAFLAGIIPAVVPSIIPSWSSEHTRFRSVATTKVINRSGILVRTEATDAGGTATTENLAWDKETGELLLTKTYTNFDDAVFNFSYPAHWSYDRMGQAYRNVNASFAAVTVAGGTATIANAASYFVKGDEVAIENGPAWAKAWVCTVNAGSIELIDLNGVTTSLPSGTCTLKILRSGRRNMQAVAVGSVVTKKNPLVDTNADTKPDILIFEEVLNAGSTEFAEQWSIAPGKTSSQACLCTLSALGGQFAFMLSSLASNKKIAVSNTVLLQNAAYAYNYTAALNAVRATPSPTFMQWMVTGGGTNIMQGVLNGTGPVSVTDCISTLTLPSGYKWDQVTGLMNIQATTVACNTTTNAFSGTAIVETVSGTEYVTFTATSSCYDMGTCSSGSTCGVQAGQTINPYFHNVLGNWRAYRNYLYLSDRDALVAGGPNGNDVDLRRAGTYKTLDQLTGLPIAFQPFWLANGGNDWTKSPSYWTWSQEVTKYTPFGNEVENKDALGRYSGAVFGYNNTLPLAVASNARHQEIGFDGFEDYSYVTQDCRQLHFSFYDVNPTPDNAQAHTGLYSMKVNAASNLAMTRQLATTVTSKPTPACPYVVAAGDLNGVFAPYTGGGARTYVLNYWVKEQVAVGTAVFNYPNAQVVVSVNGTPLALTLVQKSGIIEGWQQYQYTFTLAANQSGTVEVKLQNSNASQPAWFDDIRIHPFDANMATYVYHPINQRLTQQLDENNYATIYEYDEEGALVRVKKETERGIVTLKEARNNSYHLNPNSN
jgi:hypothetical protein